MASLRDFYMRSTGDPKYREDRVEVSDDLEETIQQINMTLFTNKGEVLGEPDFGLSIDSYLFEFELEPARLGQEANEQINRYVGEARKRSITVSPSIYPDEKSNRDIFVLLINVPELKNQIAVFYD
jgi:phage baseplate assembly protein W